MDCRPWRGRGIVGVGGQGEVFDIEIRTVFESVVSCTQGMAMAVSGGGKGGEC